MTNELWNELAAKGGLVLSEAQVELLYRYLDLLADANTRMNLTRIVDREQAAAAHVGDALTLLPFLPSEARTLVDIGSGGGVPGLPLAIARPQMKVILVESTLKKATFLRDCAQQLGLKNVQVLGLRAEDVGRGEWRERVDVVTARAVGELAFLIEWAIPLLLKGGKLLAMKGAKAQEEIEGSASVIKLMHVSAATVHPVALPGAEHHVIVELTKLGRTEPRFPRPATIAKNRKL